MRKNWAPMGVSIVVLACGGEDGGQSCPLNAQQACEGGYQICEASGWSECIPLYRDPETGELQDVNAECVAEPGLYTMRATASTAETIINCRSEFTEILPLQGDDITGISFVDDGATAVCDLGSTIADDGCSQLCESTIEGGTMAMLMAFASETSFSGSLVYELDDGRRCEYELEFTKN